MASEELPEDVTVVEWPHPVEAWSAPIEVKPSIFEGFMFGPPLCVRPFEGNILAARSGYELPAWNATTGLEVWRYVPPAPDIYFFYLKFTQLDGLVYVSVGGLAGVDALILDEVDGAVRSSAGAAGWQVVDALRSSLWGWEDPENVEGTRVWYDTATGAVTPGAPELGYQLYSEDALIGYPDGYWYDLLTEEHGCLAGHTTCTVLDDIEDYSDVGGMLSQSRVPTGSLRAAVTDPHDLWVYDLGSRTAQLVISDPDLVVVAFDPYWIFYQAPAVTVADVFAAVSSASSEVLSVCDFYRSTGERRWCVPIPDLPPSGPDASGDATPLEGTALDIALYAAGDDLLYGAWTDDLRDDKLHLFALSQVDGSVIWTWTAESSAPLMACVPEPFGPAGYIYVMEQERLVAIDPHTIAPE